MKKLSLILFSLILFLKSFASAGEFIHGKLIIVAMLTGKSKEILNWETKYKNLDGLRKGLIQTIRWFKSNEYINNNQSKEYNI